MISLVGADRFFMAYGMTEGLGLTALRADEWLDHAGSVGRGYRDTELRILDADGNDLPPGEIGEIFLRSPSSGLYKYLGGAPRLATTDDGFETAGDMGWCEADGFLHIVDRRVDMIISGGANVYPAEVESALMDLDGVLECAAYGVPDEKWGEAVAASVVLAPGSGHDQASIRNDLRARIAAYKIPKHVEFPAALPRTTSGKVLRRDLRERMAHQITAGALSLHDD
jgi:bile acid-coenzyme A ligase